jgi:hypothetical protein
MIWVWAHVCTYETRWCLWRGGYRSLILGAVKCTLCLLLALLKPIVEISKVVITLAALFKVVKIAEAIVIPRLAVLESIVCEFLCVFRKIVWLGRYVIGGGIDVGVIVYRGPVNGGCWRPFFRQWRAGRHLRNALRT